MSTDIFDSPSLPLLLPFQRNIDREVGNSVPIKIQLINYDVELIGGRHDDIMDINTAHGVQTISFCNTTVVIMVLVSLKLLDC